MEFKREIYQDLLKWKEKAKHKPLLLMGARQVGKTTIIKAFGASEYSSVLYINLEREIEVHKVFARDKNPEGIISRLSLLHGEAIKKNSTLIILDEIQECRDALISLKYFQEELPEINIIGAGSLLGITIGNNHSFPVGKIEFLDMYPLSFAEYLSNVEPKKYDVFRHFLDAPSIEKIDEVFFSSLQISFKQYLLLSGMPEVVSHFIDTESLTAAHKVLGQIQRAYELDFVKHAKGAMSTKIQHVWNAIPSQLGKENKKFLYKSIKSGARAREYEEAIQWLIQAGLVYKVAKIEKAGIPLTAYEDVTAFKIYLFETGMLMRIAALDSSVFIDGDQFFTEFKGAIAENYVAQALKKIYQRAPHYWTSNGIAEVDFLIEQRGSIIPIEVKSGTATKSKSLTVYRDIYKPKTRVRVSNLNLNLTSDLLNIPLFYAEYLDVLLNKV